MYRTYNRRGRPYAPLAPWRAIDDDRFVDFAGFRSPRALQPRAVTLPRPLLDAYRRTTYAASLPGFAVRIRIGGAPPALAGASWAFITASNPRSQLRGRRWNARSTRALCEQLRASGVAHYPARAIPDRADWEIEPGFLLRDVSLARATALGRAFGQNAIVYLPRGGMAALVEC